MRRNEGRILALILVALMTPALTYVKAVLSGEIVAGKWTKLAAQRHFDDLRRQNTAEFPFVFDEKRAEFAIAFIEQLTHTKGKWANRAAGGDAKIKLELWEKFIVSEPFGWRKADGTRRFRRAYIEVARKNGKTTFAAAIAVQLFFANRPRVRTTGRKSYRISRSPLSQMTSPLSRLRVPEEAQNDEQNACSAIREQ